MTADLSFPWSEYVDNNSSNGLLLISRTISFHKNALWPTGKQIQINFLESASPNLENFRHSDMRVHGFITNDAALQGPNICKGKQYFKGQRNI